jgi:hypothetical protein
VLTLGASFPDRTSATDWTITVSRTRPAAGQRME